jgi:hypothetical protein
MISPSKKLSFYLSEYSAALMTTNLMSICNISLIIIITHIFVYLFYILYSSYSIQTIYIVACITVSMQ